jgi:predicted RNase H-like nuclease
MHSINLVGIRAKCAARGVFAFCGLHIVQPAGTPVNECPRVQYSSRRAMSGCMIVVGVDGYSGGWVAVRIDGGRRDLRLLGSISELSAMKFDRAGIDMPIGLPECGLRDCDLQARAMLRPHASRVFTGARRGLWDHASHEAANRALKRRGEAGVSIQLWNLGPKILEVDALMTPRLQQRVRETHPELVFLRLNFGRPLPSKKTEEGIAERMKLLKRQRFTELKQWIACKPTGVKADDILDACAVAIAAHDFTSGHVLPRSGAAKDAKGLKMQIWY